MMTVMAELMQEAQLYVSPQGTKITRRSGLKNDQWLRLEKVFRCRIEAWTNEAGKKKKKTSL
jgi:hypothetical protein